MGAPANLEAARAAKKKALQRLARAEGLNGIGLCRRGAGYALKVNFAQEPPAGAIPAQIDGVDVVVEVVGRIRKLGATFHVEPREDGWVVRRAGSKRAAAVHDTQRAAIAAARELARAADGELVIHARDGSVRRG